MHIFIIVICYFILPGTSRYISIWRSCNFVCLFFLSTFYVKWSVNIYSYINTVKNFSDFTNFPANIFLFSVRKNICTAPFLDAQELYSSSTLKTNVCLFLYISVRKFLFQRRSKILSGGEWVGGRLKNFINANAFGPHKIFYHFWF